MFFVFEASAVSVKGIAWGLFDGYLSTVNNAVIFILFGRLGTCPLPRLTIMACCSLHIAQPDRQLVAASTGHKILSIWFEFSVRGRDAVSGLLLGASAPHTLPLAARPVYS